jgi:type VI protein secretion system component VasK
MTPETERSLRRRYRVVLGLFVLVLAINIAISFYANAERRRDKAAELRQEETVRSIFAEIEEKRAQADRMLKEAERRLTDLTETVPVETAPETKRQ